ncbi:MAG: 6-carboxytetrahydropterin synthase QueD [bacterium]
MFEVFKEVTFSGAHRLRDYGGRCEELHGHNWRVRIYARAGELDETGLVVDFKDMKRAMDETADALDHRYLNDVPPFDETNPSAENIARYFFDHVSEKINDDRVAVSRAMVWENDDSCAIYEPDDDG